MWALRHNKGAIETVYLSLWNLGIKILPRLEQSQVSILLQDSPVFNFSINGLNIKYLWLNIDVNVTSVDMSVDTTVHTLYLQVLEWLNVKTARLQNMWQCFDPQARSSGAVRETRRYCRRLQASTRVYSYPSALRGSGVVFSTTLLFGSTADSSTANHVELKDSPGMHAPQADNDIRVGGHWGWALLQGRGPEKEKERNNRKCWCTENGCCKLTCLQLKSRLFMKLD